MKRNTDIFKERVKLQEHEEGKVRDLSKNETQF